MSHAEVQADSSGERRGAAASFATRGSHRLHCQPRRPRDQYLRYRRGRKRQSGGFAVDTVHGQLIFGSAATRRQPRQPPSTACVGP